MRIARPDNWSKNIFILPGTALNIILVPAHLALGGVVSAILASCMVASSNYVINEWLDRHYDALHPEKCRRPAVAGELNKYVVYCEYITLAAAGITLALIGSNRYVAYVLSVFWIMGVAYNIPPLRLKEIAYLDVIVESINNPIRLLIGWFAVDCAFAPPVSVIASYWAGGAFLMAIKRFSERRLFADAESAGAYRASFYYYDERKLLVSSFIYALVSFAMMGIFLIKYKIELVLMLPLYSVLFGWYLWIAFDRDSAAQHPERLYRERMMLCFVVVLVVLTGICMTCNIPILKWLFDRRSLVPLGGVR